jgi:hypothetical protein
MGGRPALGLVANVSTSVLTKLMTSQNFFSALLSRVKHRDRRTEDAQMMARSSA